MSKKKESDSELIKRLIKQRHPNAWLIESASIGSKLITGVYGAFTHEGLITYRLSSEKQLIRTGNIIWPNEKNGEVDHFAIKSVFEIDGLIFVTGNKGKEVQQFLEGEKHNTFTVLPRSFKQKIVGFRSNTKWKQITASIIYIIALIMIIATIVDISNDGTENHNTSGSVEKMNNDVSTISKDGAKKNTAASLNKQADTDKATKTAGTTDRISVDLVETVDGDTIKVIYNGKVETVRYLLIDTPETKDPKSCVQPYGKNASDRNKQLVNSGKLEIEFDVGERMDKYGRLLAYVYADGKSVQEQLLQEGLARVAYIYPPNTRYLEAFEQAQSEAKKADLLIWDNASYVTDKGFNGCESQTVKNEAITSQPQTTTSPKPAQKAKAPTSQSKAQCNIKGNQSGIYHVPGGAFYDVTKAEKMFCSRAEAEAAGFRASKR